MQNHPDYFLRTFAWEHFYWNMSGPKYEISIWSKRRIKIALNFHIFISPKHRHMSLDNKSINHLIFIHVMDSISIVNFHFGIILCFLQIIKKSHFIKDAPWYMVSAGWAQLTVLSVDGVYVYDCAALSAFWLSSTEHRRIVGPGQGLAEECQMPRLFWLETSTALSSSKITEN